MKAIDKQVQTAHTLISVQRTAVDSILAAREQGKRAMMYGLSLLNRNPRVLRGIRQRYMRNAAKLGYTEQQVRRQWQDVKDVAKFEATAEYFI